MKYLIALAASVFLLLGFLLRANLTAVVRSFLHNTDIYEEKKFQFKGLIVVWAIFTIIVFIFVIFFVD